MPDKPPVMMVEPTAEERRIQELALDLSRFQESPGYPALVEMVETLLQRAYEDLAGCSREELPVVQGRIQAFQQVFRQISAVQGVAKTISERILKESRAASERALEAERKVSAKDAARAYHAGI